MSRTLTVERAGKAVSVAVPTAAEPGRAVRFGLTAMLGLNAVGFAWGVLVFMNNGSRDIAGFGLFMAATWLSLSVCLAGLAAGRR